MSLLFAAMPSCSRQNDTRGEIRMIDETPSLESPAARDTATFGGGCFWCLEAVFQQVRGVLSVVSGYAGGHVENPTYQQVCTGTTGHAEVVQIVFDTTVISYQQLLEVLFSMHDPTTPDRQGNDVGPQYRSIILFHTDAQREQAQRFMNDLDLKGAYNDLIVTELVPLTRFHRAEEYHQNYFAQNRAQPYCRYVIEPKVRKYLEGKGG